jgi:hypothetical protein
MNSLQDTKLVALIRPAAIADDASFTSQVVDTLGYDYATCIFQLGASDIAVAALYMQESDDNSNYTNITGTIFGTSTNTDGSTSGLPTATDDNKFEVVEIDLRGRKRYLQCVATAGNGSTGTYLSALVVLSRGEIGPVSATDRGCDEILRV